MAAQLYQIQGRYDLALAIYLRQQQPAVFDFIQEHQLLPVLHERVAQLLSIDEERAIQLLMAQYDEVPASTVVPSIQVRIPVTACCMVLLVWYGSGFASAWLLQAGARVAWKRGQDRAFCLSCQPACLCTDTVKMRSSPCTICHPSETYWYMARQLMLAPCTGRCILACAASHLALCWPVPVVSMTAGQGGKEG